MHMCSFLVQNCWTALDFNIIVDAGACTVKIHSKKQVLEELSKHYVEYKTCTRHEAHQNVPCSCGYDSGFSM